MRREHAATNFQTSVDRGAGHELGINGLIQSNLELF